MKKMGKRIQKPIVMLLTVVLLVTMLPEKMYLFNNFFVLAEDNQAVSGSMSVSDNSSEDQETVSGNGQTGTPSVSGNVPNEQEPLELKMNKPVLSVEHSADCNHSEKISGHILSVNAQVAFEVENLSEDETLISREEEIKNLLGQYELIINYDNGSKKQISLTEVVPEYNENTVNISVSTVISDLVSGTYTFKPVIYKGESLLEGDEKNCTIDKIVIEPEMVGGSQTIAYGDTISYKFKLKSADMTYICFDNIECYEVDENGEKVEGNLSISEGSQAGQVDITAKALGEHDIYFDLSEDAIYTTISAVEGGTEDLGIKTITVVKGEVDSEFNVNGASVNGSFTKADPLQIQVSLKTHNMNLLKENCENTTVSFTAVPDIEGYRTLELGAGELQYDSASSSVCVAVSVPEKIANILNQNTTYTIIATISCDEKFPYTFSKDEDNAEEIIKLLCSGFCVNNQSLELQLDNVSVEYGAEVAKIVPIITVIRTTEELQVTDSSISVKYTSSNPEIVSIDENTGEITTHKAGSATIEVVVDDADNDVCDIYNSAKKTCIVKVTSPKNTDVLPSVGKQNYESIRHLYENALSTVSKDGVETYWYNNYIVIRIPSDSKYTNIAYKKQGSNTEVVTNGKEWRIETSEPAEYEFWLVNEEVGICSIEADGDVKCIHSVAVDKTAPEIEDVLVLESQESKSIYSNSKTEYYINDIELFVCSDDGTKDSVIKNNATFLDEQSGVKEIAIYYSSDAKSWKEAKRETFSDDASYMKNYQFEFDAAEYNNSYVKIMVTDNVGFTSEAMYRGTGEDGKPFFDNIKNVKICVDAVAPQVSASALMLTSELSYTGEWTNEQVEYTLNVTNMDSIASGIQRYQYRLVPIGGNVEETGWIDVLPEEMKVLLGKAQGEYTSTDEYKFNGTIYFRAESKSGVMGKASYVTKIWQTEMNKPEIYTDKDPADTGWYNLQTGAVTVNFAYPDDYKQEVNAPGVSTVYEYICTDSDNVASSVTKEFFTECVDDETEKYISDAAIKINTDSVNKLKVYAKDEAGNISKTVKSTIKADFQAPEVKNISFDGQKQELHTSTDEEITYTYFSQNSLKVTSEVSYGISGKSVLNMQQCKSIQEWLEGTDIKTKSFSVGVNNRGFVYLHAVDKAGNEAEAWSDGFITDDVEPSGANGADITITASGANEEAFFNRDIPISVYVKDSATGDDYSGLRSVAYSIGSEEAGTTDSGTLLSFDTTKPTWEQIQEIAELNTNQISVNAIENESNEAYIIITAKDNANNVVTTKKTLKIDITAPVIEVSLDGTAENGTYYKDTRTAQIKITEKNFDPEKVSVTMYKNEESVQNLTPGANSWKTSDNLTYYASIEFVEDGDYSFSVSCVDRAGNEANTVEIEKFTIDKTVPVVEVTYDNNDARSKNYYNAPRTATIVVQEHNFSADDFILTVSPQVAISNWNKDGDTYTATVSFAQDGYYTLMLDYVDLAGNIINPFEIQDFYIDTQAPEIAITGVTDGSANAGTVVPVITGADANYDVNGMTIALKNSKGDEIALDKEVTYQEDRYSYTLTNVDGQEDQIYTLSVKLIDMAGNSSEQNYRFSLNRNGSTYDLSKLNVVRDAVYIRYGDLEDLIIKEMNVDLIKEFSIYLNKNSNLITNSREGRLPDSLEDDTLYYQVDFSGDEYIGYEYTYTIFKENFEQEGIYNVMFYSKDRAGNEVNSTLTEKNAEITFVVDNTAPTVVIDGVEAGEFYAEDHRNVNLYVTDYYMLEEAYFYLKDEDGQVLQTYNYMELAEKPGDIVTVTITSSDKSLYIDYSAKDAAGNTVVKNNSQEEVPASFMISTNAWLKFINSDAAIAVVIAVIVSAIAVLVFMIMHFKKRKIGK